jgi:RND family efflux transporter MFP subunit
VIESPEVDQQLQQAKADLATSQATANNAEIQSQRYQNLLKADAVSKQDTDNFTTQAASSNTQVQSAQANVNRLQQLVGFEKIYAPFSGTVTARNVDIGTLIDSGASREIFHLSDERVLRVYVNVPQPYSPAAKPGVHAALTLTEYPGQAFDGVIVRTAKAIDPTSRTLLVEVDVDNRDGKLYPGSYAQVHFKLGNAQPTLIIPVPALIFRAQGLQVGTVVNNKAKLVPIVIGQDDGKVVQVTQGLRADDEVIQSPPDSLIDGEAVNVVSAQQEGPPHPPGAGNPMENKPQQAGESKKDQNDQNSGSQQQGKKKKPKVEHGGKVS